MLNRVLKTIGKFFALPKWNVPFEGILENGQKISGTLTMEGRISYGNIGNVKPWAKSEVSKQFDSKLIYFKLNKITRFIG